VELNKELLAMLHGPDALATKSGADALLADEARQMLERIRTAASSGSKWHHHMMFPTCALNPSGKWRIAVEIDGSLSGTLDFDTEPSSLLSEIERVYFGLA
jgi:hypothetical protein